MRNSAPRAFFLERTHFRSGTQFLPYETTQLFPFRSQTTPIELTQTNHGLRELQALRGDE